MYIESKPTSIYVRNSGTDIAGPGPQLHRPPTILNHSSSSLNGMEKSVPSFQSFVKRTPPPPSHDKPLPPVPYEETLQSSVYSRRTSSVYSRAVSQWAPTPESWKTRNIASTNLFLQPYVYSLSTPELTLDKPAGDLLPVPRAYAPLIASPSPSPSREPTPSPPVEPRPSILLPAPLPMLRLAPHHAKTLSLGKAKAALQSPGVSPLLPEELRALAAAKKAKASFLRSSQSFEGVIPYKSSPSYLNLSPTLHPDQSPPVNWPLQSASSSNSRPSKLSDEYFGTDANIRTALGPVDKQIRESIATLDHDSVLDFVLEDYDQRGRDRTKRPSGSHRRTDDADERTEQRETSNKSIIAEAQRLANEYHALFQEGNRTSNQRKHSASSASVKEAMKLVPQPLFFNPRKVSKQRTMQYQRDLNRERCSPSGQSTGSWASHRDQESSPATQDRRPQFPLKLSLTPEATGIKRHSSTSGSIPISPPFATKFDCSPDPSSRKQSDHLPPQRKHSIDDSNRFSVFYKRINHDAEQLAKEHPGGKLTWDFNLPIGSQQEHPIPSLHRRKTSDGSGVSTIVSATSKAPLVSSVQKGIAAVTSVFGARRASTATVDSFEASSQRKSSFPIISAPFAVMTNDRHALRASAAATSTTGTAAKRPSLFAGIRDQRRESRANKRREELKRTIKVVPDTIPEMNLSGKFI